ncbi:hypothetical protein P879_00644 [Paragonimus westermani]|uniref:Uncharacterized protein n=1 Tax=Paragonimus westermani TaxID=34504 RepID=A0A8T0DIL3_9TREM|nr:hypothetical protein P879_00644 [Paragonimus westermani]
MQCDVPHGSQYLVAEAKIVFHTIACYSTHDFENLLSNRMHPVGGCECMHPILRVRCCVTVVKSTIMMIDFKTLLNDFRQHKSSTRLWVKKVRAIGLFYENSGPTSEKLCLEDLVAELN